MQSSRTIRGHQMANRRRRPDSHVLIRRRAHGSGTPTQPTQPTHRHTCINRCTSSNERKRRPAPTEDHGVQREMSRHLVCVSSDLDPRTARRVSAIGKLRGSWLLQLRDEVPQCTSSTSVHQLESKRKSGRLAPKSQAWGFKLVDAKGA